MKIKLLIIFSALFTSIVSAGQLSSSTLATGIAVVPHDKPYYKYKQDNIEIIYTKDNIPFARHTADIETSLNKDYETYFGWRLDETLYVGLISCNNQIANGFSTQWPNNRQINYVGGAKAVDYFSSTSWLDMLLYHETAHNYQLNVKGSIVSRVLHSVFGNGSFLVSLPIILPNSTENSFMLEGNAVLNESWHGNGGRLYSGRFKVETILQAGAGNIVAGDVYNSKLSFPFRQIHYIQGGFYNLYMAEKYGIESLNSYFINHSYHWYWPFLTNRSMYNATGVSFEESLNEFASIYAKLAQKVVLAEGKPIASSQFFYSLGNDKDEIFFIINKNGVDIPELVIVDKNSLNTAKNKESWLGGKVIKVDAKYYTQAGANTSPYKIYQGLFDNDAFIKDQTESKIVQGYLRSGEVVYFDVKSSYSQPQLYVGDRFYAQVNSSVIIDKDDNLYYFVQKGKTRTLYKNKNPLYSYEGFYGMVSDVDSIGAIYFVANSENGSTLYRYENKKVTRASDADNIIEARLLNDKEVLLASISDKEYYYITTELQNIEQTPFETKLFFEDKNYYGEYKEGAKENYAKINTSNPYNSLLDMHYSGANFYLSAAETITGSLNLNFGDPLSQNAASIFLNRNESNTTIAGLSYSNAQYLLNYTLTAYEVVDNNNIDNVRDNGLVVQASLPFYQAGHYYGSLNASYYQDYDTLEREPLSVSLGFLRAEKYGIAMHNNYLNSLTLYGVGEREDIMIGTKYNFTHELPSELYLSFGAKYSMTTSNLTNKLAQTATRGVKLSNIAYQEDMDISTIYMPNLHASGYAKSIGFAEFSLAKVFNFSSYWFTFPLSLQRESLYAKYRYYELEIFTDDQYKYRTEDVNEFTLGATFSTVLMNSLELPLSIEYIYNDAYFVKDENKVKFIIGSSF